MSEKFPELYGVRLEMRAEARARHIRAIQDELRAAQPVRRRWRLMVVAVAIVLTLPVLALASQRAEPGDILYPVREVVDWVTDLAPSGVDTAAQTDRADSEGEPVRDHEARDLAPTDDGSPSESQPGDEERHGEDDVRHHDSDEGEPDGASRHRDESDVDSPPDDPAPDERRHDRRVP